MFHLRAIILLTLNVQFICLSSPIEQSKSYVSSIFEGLGFSPVCVASTLASCERFAKPDCNPNVPEFITELKSWLCDVKYDIPKISAPEDTKKQNLTNIIERQVTKNATAIDEIKNLLNDLNVSIKKITENLTTFHNDLLAIKESMEFHKSLTSKISNVSSSNSDTITINCAEDSLPDGVTTVYLYEGNVSKPVVILCDQTIDGGGWTVIQNRDALPVRENFERGFDDYVDGFGDLNGEFWLGLDHIHALTKSTPMELRVDLEDYDGVKKWAKYDLFGIGDKSKNYELTLGNYSGDAGNSFSYQNNMMFSTYDQDNDRRPTKCEKKYQGGWWNKSCLYSNLNGYQYVGDHNSRGEGINWYHFRGEFYSLKKASMKLRPKSSN